MEQIHEINHEINLQKAQDNYCLLFMEKWQINQSSDLITNINMKKILKNMSKVVNKSQKPYKQKNIVKQIPQQRVLITKKQPMSTRTSMKTFAQQTVKHSLSNVDKPYYPNYSNTVNLLYKSILKKYPDVGNNKITETDISLILSQLNLPADMSKWTTQNKITIGNIIKVRIKNPKPEITQQQIQYNPVQFTQDYSEADTRKFEYTVSIDENTDRNIFKWPNPNHYEMGICTVSSNTYDQNKQNRGYINRNFKWPVEFELVSFVMKIPPSILMHHIK